MARKINGPYKTMKVSATNLALELIEDLKKDHGEELLFHQSGGCCAVPRVYAPAVLNPDRGRHSLRHRL